MEWSRRQLTAGLRAAALANALPLPRLGGGAGATSRSRDRVLICNEDSNTLSVLDPETTPARPSGWRAAGWHPPMPRW
jgi:hypothetical protein